MACHGDDPKKIKGDLDMRSRESLLLGGETYEDEVLISGREKKFFYILSTGWKRTWKCLQGSGQVD